MTQSIRQRYPQHIVDRALRKNLYLQRWRKACEARRVDGVTDRELAERIVADARRAEGECFKISVRSLFRWWRDYNRLESDSRLRAFEGLIDQYQAPDRGVSRSPDATEYFFSLYRTENKLAVTVCHEHALRESARRGWTWPESYAATVAWLQRQDDLSFSYLCRHGKRAWSHKFLPHVTRDYGKLQVAEWYVADHSPLDLFCMYKGNRIRAWMTAVMDMRSRYIVGWRVGPSPNQEAIIAALHMAFRDRAVPEHLYVDCGKDFGSKRICGSTKQERTQLRKALGKDWREVERRSAERFECDDHRWLGIAGELDVKVHFALAYSPWSKSLVERWFRTMEERGVKPRFPSYTGNSPADKPECVDQIAPPTIEQIRAGIAAYIDEYHKTRHRSLGGATPLDVWHTAVRLRRADHKALAFLMKSSPYRVTANGVRVRGVLYTHPELAGPRFVGRDILVAADPENLADVWAIDLDSRKLLFPLRPEAPIQHGATDDDSREAIAEKRRAQALAQKVQRASSRRTLTMVERINESNRRNRAVMSATGTDDHHPTSANIVPVRTGFEGLSTAFRSRSDAVPMPDHTALEDLIDNESEVYPVGEDEADDLTDLLPDNDVPTDCTPDGLDLFDD